MANSSMTCFPSRNQRTRWHAKKGPIGTDGLRENMNCESISRGATIKQMANDPKLRSYARTFWSRYSKDLFNWTVKTFWLRLFILLAVPVVLIYEKKHVDWAATFISVWLFVVVIAGYMLWHLYATAKALDAERQMEFDGLLKHGASLAEEVDRLSWPENRPIIIFDHWGEVPHDDPRAGFLEVTEYRKEREYWERGIFLLNRGGDAHEIDVMPIEIAKGVETRNSYIARIDAGSTGFAFTSMDYQKNVRFKGDDNVWDLPRNMGAIEDKLNAVNIAEGKLAVEVGVRYRDANHAWYLSWCTMEYRREQNKIVFHHTNHRKFGSEKPELS
jgi:hypothetical protein